MLCIKRTGRTSLKVSVRPERRLVRPEFAQGMVWGHTDALCCYSAFRTYKSPENQVQKKFEHKNRAIAPRISSSNTLGTRAHGFGGNDGSTMLCVQTQDVHVYCPGRTSLIWRPVRPVVWIQETFLAIRCSLWKVRCHRRGVSPNMSVYVVSSICISPK